MEKNYKTKNKKNILKGVIVIPSDKSISHRSLIIGSLTKSKIEIKNFSKGADCLATLDIVKNLGGKITFKDDNTLILDASNCYKKPQAPLDCKNSGTSMRLFSGLLAGQNFKSLLVGDESLSKRPMKRVIEPLTLMGAKIKGEDNKAPLLFEPAKLSAVTYKSKIASAQVKSCILLAGLSVENGATSVIEPYLSRNHTEIMLQYFNADVKTSLIEEGYKTTIQKSSLEAKNLQIAGDISSAAFFMVASAIVENSSIIIKNVGLNPTRTGILDVMKKTGVDFTILNTNNVSGEEVGDIQVNYSPNLKPVEISSDLIPRLIDELPVIAVLLSQAEGVSVIKNAQDLRNKESDRIATTVSELSKIGIKIQATSDGFIIEGKTKLKGGVEVESFGDHRLAMSLFVASLICREAILIKDFNWIDISFPTFLKLMADLGVS